MAKEDFSQSNPNILFDLRQTYAMHLLTPIILELRMHRKEDNYRKWFESITEDLYVEVNQKLKETEKKEYKELYNKVVTVLNQYPYTYNGTDKRPENKAKVKQSLMELEMWLKEKMEEHGIYGKGSDYDWDEI